MILIFSDVNMPGMSGFELLPKVRVAHPDVPVFMITAHCDAETRRKASDGGASGLFTKPIPGPPSSAISAAGGCSTTLPTATPSTPPRG